MGGSTEWIGFAHLVVGVLFAFACLLFLYKAFTDPRPATAMRYDIVHLVCALCAATSGVLISGSLLLSADVHLSGGGRLAVQGTSGLALFALVFLRFGRKHPAPYIDTSADVASVSMRPSLPTMRRRFDAPKWDGTLKTQIPFRLPTRRILKWGLGLAVVIALAIIGVRLSSPPVDPDVVACAKETGFNLEPLQAEPWWTALDKLDMAKEVRGLEHLSGRPTDAKKRFFFLACADRKLTNRNNPQWMQSCTKEFPCVDIVRVGDFTESRCGNPSGKPPAESRDFVRLIDHVTVYPPIVERYESRARPDNAQLEVVNRPGF